MRMGTCKAARESSGKIKKEVRCTLCSRERERHRVGAAKEILQTGYCNTLQHAAHCNTLQHTAVRGSTLQYAAAHCKTNRARLQKESCCRGRNMT